MPFWTHEDNLRREIVEKIRELAKARRPYDPEHEAWQRLTDQLDRLLEQLGALGK